MEVGDKGWVFRVSSVESLQTNIFLNALQSFQSTGFVLKRWLLFYDVLCLHMREKMQALGFLCTFAKERNRGRAVTLELVQCHACIALLQKPNQTTKACWEDEIWGLKWIVPGDSQWGEPQCMLNDSAITPCHRSLDFKRTFGQLLKNKLLTIQPKSE